MKNFGWLVSSAVLLVTLVGCSSHSSQQASAAATDARPSAQSDDMVVRNGDGDGRYMQPEIVVGKTYRVREGWLTQDFAKSAMLAEFVGNDDGLQSLKQTAQTGYFRFSEDAADPSNDYPRCYVLPQEIRHAKATDEPVRCKLVSGDRAGSTIWATWITVRHD